MTQSKATEQRILRKRLSRAYCWSSPNEIEEGTLIQHVLRGLDLQDICLILSVYGEKKVRNALKEAVNNEFISDEIIRFVNLKLGTAKAILDDI